MIIETGHFALVLALCVACIQATLPIMGAHTKNSDWMAIGPPAAVTQLLLLVIAFGSLMYGFVTSDFSVNLVVNNSHTLKPLLYKISGVWGNHEGSMLMWVLILAIYGSAIAVFGNNLRPTLKARVIAIQGLLGVGFLLFILFTSNPFNRIFPAPLDGQDLNPLLQDPGLAFHPPLLYLGYVGFSTTFSFAVGALLEGRVDPAWARWVRPWTLLAWAFLTAGIVLGSWWAYYELGWGGWWFWDPVENASFMPWLIGTALLHSSIVLEKRNALKSWTIFLAIITFAFSMLGTFLVRSGVITSVHAFASDPTRGIFILALLGVFVGSAFFIYAWRAPLLKGSGLFQPISREGSLLFNNLLLTVATASVLLGTLYPLFLDVFDLGKVSVGAPYFNSIFVPLMAPMILVMGFAPYFSWKRTPIMTIIPMLKIPGIIAITGTILVWILVSDSTVLASLGIGLGIWLFFSSIGELAKRIHLYKEPLGQSWRRLLLQPRASWGMTLAHCGLAFVIIGITASSAWQTESIQIMKSGDKLEIRGYEFKLLKVQDVRGPNYVASQGIFAVTKGTSFDVILTPEKRIYDVNRKPTTEAAIHSTFFGDLYAVIGDSNENGGFVTRIYFNPLVIWMWFGTLVMVVGAGISLSDRRHRVGAPLKEEKPTALPSST